MEFSALQGEPLADRGEEAPNFEFGKLVDLVIFFCSTCEEDLAVKVGASLEKVLETEGTIGTTTARAEVEDCATVLNFFILLLYSTKPLLDSELFYFTTLFRVVK